METKGDCAPEVEAVYTRIAQVGERTGQSQYVFGALGGLFLSYMGRQHDTAQGFADRLLDLAERSKDRDQLLIAHAMMGINLFWKGDLTIAHTHFEQAAAHIDPPRQRHIVALYGMDVATGCSGYAARRCGTMLPKSSLGDQTRALGRHAIASRQRFRLIAASGTGSFIARAAKSTVTKAVMSATVKRSPDTNSFSANRRSRSA